MHSRFTSPLKGVLHQPPSPWSKLPLRNWPHLGILATFVKGIKLPPNRNIRKGVGEVKGDGVGGSVHLPDPLITPLCEAALRVAPPGLRDLWQTPQPHPGPSPLPHLVSCEPRTRPQCFPAPRVHRYPDAGPALHDGHHRGFLHQPHASADRHLQCQLGPHRQREDGGRAPGAHAPSDGGWREQGKVTPMSSQKWGRMGPGGMRCVGVGNDGSNDGVEQGAGRGWSWELTPCAVAQVL